MAADETERILAGRYRLCAVIGQGGMGAVWRARDELLGRDVAVKEIIWPPRLDVAERETARRRAVREAQLAARLRHPNVVSVYDILEEDGRPCIVMELVPFRSLRDAVAEDGPMSPAEAARVGADAAPARARRSQPNRRRRLSLRRHPSCRRRSAWRRRRPVRRRRSWRPARAVPWSSGSPGRAHRGLTHDGHYVYVRDPADSGIFLLIDQSDQPKPNPLADWREQAANRQGSYPGYHLILLREVRYAQAEKAADWEFTYERNGVTVQVLNRNILANARHAYALYWSTPASDWNAYYHYFQVFAATFTPASATRPG